MNGHPHQQRQQRQRKQQQAKRVDLGVVAVMEQVKNS
jgi:hypothetical protein